MAVVIDESAVPGLKVCFNPVIVRETRDTEDAILECLDGRRFAVLRRDLAINSGFFKALFTHSEGDRPRVTSRRRNTSRNSLPVYSLPMPVTSKTLGSQFP